MSTINYDDEKYRNFNDSLDEEGPVTIAGIDFQPSRILYELAEETYKEAFWDFDEQTYTSNKQLLVDTFPSIIAYPYRLSEKGHDAHNPMNKLLLLKDTWEGIVYFLYALVMGEIRYRKLDLTSVRLLQGESLIKVNSDKLLSYRLSEKLNIINAILIYSRKNQLGLMTEVISEELILLLIDLVSIRADFSHSATPTSAEAIQMLEKTEPLIRELITKIQWISECQILRFESLTSVCRCQVFKGHTLNSEFETVNINPEDISTILNFGNDQLFIHWRGIYFSLSPFLHYLSSENGRESYICFYKDRKSGSFWYEVISNRKDIKFPDKQADFEAEKNELISILVEQ